MRFLVPPLLVFLSGCAVGPDYERPEFDLPAKWLNGDGCVEGEAKAQNTPWWASFNDSVLSKLVGRALENNLDVLTAKERLRETRGDYKSQLGSLFPAIGAKYYAERDRNVFIFPNIPVITYDQFFANFDAQWELDIFGGNRRKVEAANALAEAAAENLRAVHISIAAEVVRNYVELREYQHLVRVTERAAETQEETASLRQKQHQVGSVSKPDNLRTDAQWRSAQSQLPTLRAALSQSQHRLELLLGLNPGELGVELASQGEGEIPLPAEQRILETPTAVIRDRPDVQVAERHLAAATALHGAAIAEMYPKISLTSFFGGGALASNAVFKPASKSWRVFGGASLPLFAFGQIQGQIDAADARQQQAFFQYKKAVLTALAEVETTLKAYVEERQRLADLEESEQDLEKAYELAQKQRTKGVISRFELLDAERNLLTAQVQTIQSRTNVATYAVALYKALGVGALPESGIQNPEHGILK